MEPTGIVQEPPEERPFWWLSVEEKDLLIKSAKALGLHVRRTDIVDKVIVEYKGRRTEWNPFDDVGQAFELLVNLQISINADEPIEVGTYDIGGGKLQGEYEQGCEVWIVKPWVTSNTSNKYELKVTEVYKDNAAAATRRGIVRLAALIWEQRSCLPPPAPGATPSNA